MVQKNTVFRKSAHGAEALAKRDPALTLRLRSLLILVDGKRSVEELAKLSPTGPETEQLVSQLDDLGMIEPALAAAPPPPASAEAATPAAAQAAAPAQAVQASAGPAAAPVQVRVVPLPEARQAASRRLTDLLGPQAEDLCLRIEGARTAQDLLAILKKAEVMVRSARGPEAAAEFHRHMEAHRPA